MNEKRERKREEGEEMDHLWRVCVCETRSEIKRLRERMLYLSLTCITHSSSSSSLTSPSLSFSSSSVLAVQHVLLIIEEY